MMNGLRFVSIVILLMSVWVMMLIRVSYDRSMRLC